MVADLLWLASVELAAVVMGRFLLWGQMGL
jgi:hypothetical protein